LEGTNITPFGVSKIWSFNSCRTCCSGENGLTPSVLAFDPTTLPRQVQKQRLYAIIMDGYKDWKSSTTTGSE